MYALENMTIYTGEEILKDKYVIIEGKRIKSISDKVEGDMEIINLEGMMLAPSFIDLQINGCGGVLFNDNISVEALKKMNESNIKSGCTSFLPTLVSTSDENIKKALELFAKEESLEDIGVLGLHIEGPYINALKKGIHNLKYIRSVDNEMLDILLEKAPYIKMMTIAPETTQEKILDKLSKAGIRLSIGHSNGTYEEVMKKLSYYHNATHLYNAMSPFEGREPGVVGAILDSENIYVGIIVDGIHSHFASVRIAKKILKDRLYLVSDAVSLVGSNMDSFSFEGNKVYYRNGKCLAEDGTLGGSALTMIEGVRNLVKNVGINLDEALRMASTYPAKVIGVEKNYGYIKENYIADMLVLDEKMNLKKVFLKGKRVKKI